MMDLTTVLMVLLSTFVILLIGAVVTTFALSKVFEFILRDGLLMCLSKL